MFRKLPLALMMGAALAGNAYALGVGGIKINSALNQRLNAEIELISTVEGELDDVSVGLASPEDFRRIKLDRPYHLTSLKFEVTTRKDGTPIVKLTSSEAIREPFLNFLVEVDWPNGHMLREYTVLLDPPVTISAPPSPKPGASPAAEPATPSVADSSAAEGDDLGYPDVAVVYPSEEGSYGPVEAQQTLWSIANEVRTGDVTTQQMMLALFDANPDAFIDGNIHNIRKGSILRIPDQGTITSRDRAEAIARVREVNTELDMMPTAETTMEQPGVVDVMPESTPEPMAEPEKELKIVSAEGSATAGAASAEMESLKTELSLATESLASQKMENDELRSRIEELEATVVEMDKLRRLLEIQNQEMKQLQDSLATEQPAPAAPPMPAPEPVAPVVAPEPEPKPVAKPEPKPEPKPAAKPPAPEAKPKPAPKPAPLPPPAQKSPMDVAMDYVNKVTSNPMLLAIIGGVLVVIIALVMLVVRRKGKGEEAPEEVALPETQEPATVEVVEAEAKPSFFAGMKDKIQGLSKKKQKAADEAEAVTETTDAFEGAEDITDPGVSAPEPSEQETVMEQPPAADITDMDFEADVSQPEPAAAAEPEQPAAPAADPLEEVDVYEAFGDYEQAAEIVRQAISDYPDNNEYKLRLFKVYEAGGMQAEFSQDAESYKDAMAGTAEWSEIEEIGKAFVPDSAAFGGAGMVLEPAEESTGNASVDMESTMAMDFATAGEVSGSASEAESAEGEEAESDLDFGDFGGLDFETGESAEEKPSETMEAESTEALDDSANVAVAAASEPSSGVDLSDMEFEEPSGATQLEPEADQSIEEEQSLEFDLGDLGTELEAAEEPEAAAESPAESEPAGNELEFDLGDLSLDQAEAEPGQAAEKPQEQGNELEFDLGDFELGDVSEEPEAPTDSTVAVDTIDDGADMSMDFELDDVPEAEQASPTPSDTVSLDIGEGLEEAGSEDPTVMPDTSGVSEADDLGLDLSDFSLDEDTGSDEAALDLDMDLELGGSEEPTLMTEEDSLGQSLSAEGDEVATKLDLARAYIDMGDSDGAKGILQEVLEEGNDAQKSEAEDLLKST